MKQIPPPTVSTLGDWIKLKNTHNPTIPQPPVIPPAVNLRSNHPPPSEGLGEASKKPPDFTPMAWCFAINQTLSLAAT
jgi:hypothetical protein